MCGGQEWTEARRAAFDYEEERVPAMASPGAK
jgi:hypothetical protein